jgi:hypothetical protein
MKIVRRRSSKVSWSSGSKLDMKWCGPFRIVSKASTNIYNCLNLRTNKNVQLDVSSLKIFQCPPHLDPVVVAGMDEGEFVGYRCSSS